LPSTAELRRKTVRGGELSQQKMLPESVFNTPVPGDVQSPYKSEDPEKIKNKTNSAKLNNLILFMCNLQGIHGRFLNF
jgi:hypothetical protein